MKQGLYMGLAVILACLLLPLAVMGPLAKNPVTEEALPLETEVFSPVTAPPADPEEAEKEAVSFDDGVRLSVLFQGIPVEMPLHEYLVGVLLGELPGGFEPWAFAAQAVACRTYTLKVMERGKHPEGAVCTDHRCCQAWREPGTADPEVLEKVDRAVRDTDGLVLTYGGTLIDATYFSCSGGKTEDAAAVWGSAVPYLVAVDSPGEEQAPRYAQTLTLSAEEVKALLLAEDPDCELTGTPECWFGSWTVTPGGGVSAMTVGGTVFPGTVLRRLFGLNSTVFSVSVEKDSVTFATRGFGHRVGLSQYGAQAMALAGKDYPEILAHYYPGTTLQVWGDT